MNIRDYYNKKEELEYLIEFNRKIHCPHVAAKWQRELDRLEKQYQEERSDT